MEKALNKSKYTFDYNSHIESLLDESLNQIAHEAQQAICAKHLKYLVLGGGYGRGEGGILKRENGETDLYNDLDFFVISDTFIPHINKELDLVFQRISKEWHSKLHIDVDFSRSTYVGYIKKRLHIQMWREMVLGAQILVGDKNEFKKDFRNLPPQMPSSETAKLLINRLTGLFLARQKLFQNSFSNEDYDFIARNINKAILACGDAVLLSLNKYVFRTEDRLQLLNDLKLEDSEFLNELKRLYVEAVEFKKYPRIISNQEHYNQKYEQIVPFCEKVIVFTHPYLLCKNGKTVTERLKEIKLLIQLRHSLCFFGVKFSFSIYPHLVIISVLVKLLQAQKPASALEKAEYMKIWKRIG